MILLSFILYFQNLILLYSLKKTLFIVIKFFLKIKNLFLNKIQKLIMKWKLIILLCILGKNFKLCFLRIFLQKKKLVNNLI